MKCIFCAALLAFSLLPSFGQGEQGKPSLEELRKSLASDDFKVRTNATKGLWEMGEEALGFLAELQKSDDPELAVRAGVLRKKIRIGILPDTPRELAEALESYFDGDERAKRSLIEELYEDKQFELLVRLRALEKDERMLKNLDSRIGRIIPQLVRGHLIEGEVEKAREYLKLGNTFDNLIAYGNFLQVHGELEDEIRALEKSTDPELQRRYLAYLRVKGDAELLKKEAERLDDQQAAAAAALVLGDATPLLKIYAEMKSSPPEDLLLVKLLLARRAGEREKVAQLEKSLREISLERESAERGRLNLYRAGLVDYAGESAEKSGKMALSEHLIMTDQNRKVPAVFGLKEGKVTDDWTKQLMEKVKVELRKGNSSAEGVSLLRQVMFFYESRGEIATSTRLFSAFLSNYGPEERENFSNLIPSMRYSAPLGGMIALSEEIDQTELTMEEVLEENYADPFQWFYEKVKELEPDLSTADFIVLLHSFSGSPAMPLEEIEEWRERLEVVCLKELEKGKISSLKSFYQLQLYAGRASDRWRLLELPALAKDLPYPHAQLATQLQKWEKAAQLYEEQSPDLKTVYPRFLSQKSLAFAKVGKREEADELLKLATLLGNGTSTSLISLATQHQEYQEYEKSDELLKDAILRSEDAIFGSLRVERTSLLAYLGNSLLNSGKWKEASELLEAATISRSADSSSFALVSSFKIKMCHGLLAFDEGRRDEGLALLEEAHSIIPASGSLADHLFPALRERGITVLHDRLCLKTLDLLRQEIAAFPNDYSAKNTFSWVASRSNRNLVEAEEMMVAALKGNPFSAPFLDTMGEVKFAMKKREDAILWSEKAVDYMINDPAIRTQLERFRTGDFPVK